MRKKYALILPLLLGIVGFSYSQTHLSEDFSSGLMPPTEWSIDNLASQWSNSSSNQAGGALPEARFKWKDATDSSRLVSPVVNLTGFTYVTLVFNHYYDFYSGSGTVVGVATRSGGGNWTTAWEISPTSDVGPQNIVLPITNNDVGKTDFQFCFYIKGNLTYLNFWYIDDVLLFTPLATDVSLASISLPSYIAPNMQITLKGTVKNIASNIINSFDISYAVDGGSPNVYSVTGLNLALWDTYFFTHDIPIVLSQPGIHNIVVTVENINGGPDDDLTNNSLSAQIGLLPSVPKKKMFAEEATGTWCGWCIRGICAMDYMAETYPDSWIGVAVHNNDPMVNVAYDNALMYFLPDFFGYPSGTIDRSGKYMDPLEFEAEFLARVNTVSPATVGIYNFKWNPDTRIVSFDVQSEFVIDVAHELRFAAVISEDSVTGTTSNWSQHNYYSGGSIPMCGFENLPNPVAAGNMHYDHVARKIIDSPNGTPGSITGPIRAGSIHYYSYKDTIPAGWNFDKLHFIGLLIDYTTGVILNSNDEVSTLGITESKSRIEFKVYPNPVNSFANIVFTITSPQAVSLSIKDLMGRTIYTGPPKKYPAGENAIRFEAGNLDNGIYLLQLKVDNDVYSKKISVLR